MKDKNKTMYYVDFHGYTSPIIEVQARKTNNYIFITDEIGIEKRLSNTHHSRDFFETPNDAREIIIKRLEHFKEIGERRRHRKDNSWARQADNMAVVIKNFNKWYKERYEV